MKKNLLWTLLALVGVSVVVLVFFVFFGKKEPQNPVVDHLIYGVSYHGFYNELNVPSGFPTTFSSALNSVLDYWNDERFGAEKIDYEKEILSLSSSSAGSAIFSQNVQNFFKGKGYEVLRYGTFDPAKSLKIIKGFVNSQENIPVIVYQRYIPDSEETGFRLVIGLSDSEQKVISHDYFFGNNYKISYNDFAAMFDGDAHMIFVMLPGSDLAKQLPVRGDSSFEYPARTAELEDVSHFLKNHLGAVSSSEKSINSYEEFVGDERFGKLLPPAYQVIYYSDLAEKYIETKDPQKAVSLLSEKAIPINKDLNQPFSNFSGQIDIFNKQNYDYMENSSFRPYYVLCRAYVAIGDKIQAEKVFDDVTGHIVNDKNLAPHPFYLKMKTLLSK